MIFQYDLNMISILIRKLKNLWISWRKKMQTYFGMFEVDFDLVHEFLRDFILFLI